MINSKFTIYQLAAVIQEERPPISSKVREYLNEFIIKKVLERKNIIINAKWNIHLALYFVARGRYGPDSILLGKGARTVSAENVKIYEVLIPI
jgi:hypothetical protein